MAATFETIHPDPEKQGVSIDEQKYRTIREAILRVLDDQGPIGFGELTEEVAADIGPGFDGSIPWYVTTVKLDLEARKEIRVDRSGKRQMIGRP